MIGTTLMISFLTECIYPNCRWVQAVAREVLNFLRMPRTCQPLVSIEIKMNLLV